ncbi:MAG: hypothetical protein BGP00_07330 [Novosphingobium sp. 63-713]|nr:MAG: hypothetical protein BGP00_07330 [Novosphingobium sp. 63-713]
MNAKLLEQTKALGWSINLYGKDEAQGKGAHLGLSHVITYEDVVSQNFVDPRDGNHYFNTAYSFGVNTIIFDVNDRQVKALVPAIITYNEITPGQPDKLAKTKGFGAIFDRFGDGDSAMDRWLVSIKSLPIRHDERTFFQVVPLELSDSAKASLANTGPVPAQSAQLFSRRMTSHYESLLALTFGKPIVPVAVAADGAKVAGNAYVANIPDCLGTSSQLVLPDPSYKMRLTVDKLTDATIRHDIASTDNGQGATEVQTEFAYGGRFRSEILQFDSLNGDKPIDAHVFRFVRSLRFSGSREVDKFDQFSKLTSNFMKELLDAYAFQKRDWVKDNISASISDKKQKDPARIAKEWKVLLQDTMKVAPAPQGADVGGR